MSGSVSDEETSSKLTYPKANSLNLKGHTSTCKSHDFDIAPNHNRHINNSKFKFPLDTKFAKPLNYTTMQIEDSQDDNVRHSWENESEITAKDDPDSWVPKDASMHGYQVEKCWEQKWVGILGQHQCKLSY